MGLPITNIRLQGIFYIYKKQLRDKYNLQISFVIQ